MPKPDRQQVLLFARNNLQVFLSEPDVNPEDRLDLAKGFLEGVNSSLAAHGYEETDIQHLLPSFTSDPALITYQQVIDDAIRTPHG